MALSIFALLLIKELFDAVIKTAIHAKKEKKSGRTLALIEPKKGQKIKHKEVHHKKKKKK